MPQSGKFVDLNYIFIPAVRAYLAGSGGSYFFWSIRKPASYLEETGLFPRYHSFCPFRSLSTQ